MKKEDLELVLEWRNRPEIREKMFTNHEISRAEHYSWFERTQNDSSKEYLICLDEESKPIGVVCFTEISRIHHSASWAFYSGDLTRRGVGSQMETIALQYAFNVLKLEKLSCEVLGNNYRVVSLHRKFGFRIEGIFKKHFCFENDRIDVYRLALTQRDWRRTLENNKSSIQVGDSYSKERTITREEVRAFAEVTGDRNPIHLDASVAKQNKFKDVICHGMLSGSLFSQVLGTEFPGNGTIYLKQTCEFLSPIYPDQSVTIQLKVLSKIGNRVILDTRLLDTNKNDVFVGEAEVVLPQA